MTVATLLTLVFFWLVEHARLQRYLLSFAPLDRRAGMRDAWNEIESRLGLWVRGQLILMGTMGVSTGIAYTLLGLPGAVLLGLIAALTEAIPSSDRCSARSRPSSWRRPFRPNLPSSWPGSTSSSSWSKAASSSRS